MTSYPDKPQYVLHNANKEPCDHTGALVNPHDPSTWMTYEEAQRHALMGYGVGFVITKDDPYFIVDIDDCRDPATGTYDERAIRWNNALPGAMVEVSRSGRGLHFWGCCEAGLDEHYYNRKDGIEFYQSGRYVALGSMAQGDLGIDWTQQLRAYLTPRPEPSQLPETGPVPEYTGPSDDATLLQMMMDARGSAAVAFNTKARFKDLWNANAEALAQFFPSHGDEPFDRSDADSALLTHLAFWTGKDRARMERLWLSSPLVTTRPDQKKIARADYRARTVDGAAGVGTAVY